MLRRKDDTDLPWKEELSFSPDSENKEGCMKIPGISRSFSALSITITLLVLVPLLLTACQEVFTYSLLEGMQRDFSSLPREQKISYAKDVLASGDADAMADIYDEIAAMAASDPELYLLAADLAMGASGITGIIDDVLSAEDPSTLVYADILASVDMTMMGYVADNVLAAEAAGLSGITEEQYATAAGAEILFWLDQNPANDVSSIDWTDSTTAAASGPEIANAYNFLVSAGQNPAEFDDIFG